MTAQAISLEVFGRSDVGRRRTSNEDAFVIADLNKSPAIEPPSRSTVLEADHFGVLLAVSDGMGVVPQGRSPVR